MIKDYVAGIDIGGTKVAVAIARAGGPVLARGSVPSGVDSDPHRVLGDALALIESLAEQHQARPSAVGVGCAGPLDLARGLVSSPPNLPRWRDFPLVSIVEERLRVPVAFDNDANAAALGEHRYGAGMGLADMVYLTISTGIGGGIIAGGELVHRAGEAGHITVQPDGEECPCGARGCMEALCSGTGLARRARSLLRAGWESKMLDMADDIEDVTAETVLEAARSGDELALDLWRETVHYMAVGIGSMVTLLAPQAVILGGGVAAGAGHFLLHPLREQLNERVRIVRMERVPVRVAGLGADSGLYGALALGARALPSSLNE